MKKCADNTITKKYKVGLDEVGRGPLAGPVTVGCVFLPMRYTWSWFAKQAERGLPPLRDSKKLTQAQREHWYAWVITQSEIVWAVASTSSAVIDAKGIVYAANSAADNAYTRAARKLANNSEVEPLCVVGTIRLDYGLRAQRAGKQNMYKKGDEKYPEIALASIMAKVTRDRYMQKLDKELPMYSFAAHKGYGSLAHRKAIQSHGLSKQHRASFIHGDNTLGKKHHQA